MVETDKMDNNFLHKIYNFLLKIDKINLTPFLKEELSLIINELYNYLYED